MITDYLTKLKPGTSIKGPLFKEEVQVIAVLQLGTSLKVQAKGESNQFYAVIIPEEKLSEISIVQKGTFDGDPIKFRLIIEALRLGLAYEYDPYFSLSISRVDPLPHQLEAVYEYFLKLPRIRFLLADDPGAGKTIMAGLLIKELKSRGMIKRVLIVTPANLSFQWQRELKDKFRENFEVIRSDILRANYGSNPWQEKDQVITSVSWVSRIEDAKDSLMRSTWDLVIVDEAHKMSAYDEERKTLAYKLGEALSERTDHFLLMTATPHKGDPRNFQLFLKLLDPDVYADIVSLDEAMEQKEAPFYLRRVKEALVTFPDPNTGVVKSLFTKRIVRTITFRIQEEYDFYHELTRFVEEQSMQASGDTSPRGRAVGFTMAMLQRRFASSLYAVRRSLERMKIRREKILADPEAYRQEQINKKLPDDFEDLTDEEQIDILEQLENSVLSYDPAQLRLEIDRLGRLIDQAKALEVREIETKIARLKEELTKNQIFSDPKVKLLIFTEHKDTLDYLAGDGKEGRPLGKLIQWGLTVTTIHGGMKIGDRNTPGTRIYAEREFREPECQILVATEAAGEGINLQFCWLMINYDIPWNPVRLEQRMGRIHRYGQEKDCLIFNFVSENTREGRVMQKLLDRIEQIEDDIDPQRTGKIFNVLGDIFPSNLLEKMLRDMYSRNYESEKPILDRIVEDVDTERFRQITNSTLEGLAKRELNLSAIIGKSEEAKERRLVPEVIEDFFLKAAPHHGIQPREIRKDSHIFKIGKVPRNLWHKGDQLEPRFGKLGTDYKQVVFSQDILKKENSLEWITPGHPLFECIRETTIDQFKEDLKKGAIFYDVERSEPARLDIFSASIVDGLNRTLHRRLFVLESRLDGTIELRQPTIFIDLLPADDKAILPETTGLPTQDELEHHLISNSLGSYLEDVVKEREKEVNTISHHMELSLNELISKQNERLATLVQQEIDEPDNNLVKANRTQVENKIMELMNRLESRQKELEQEKQCTIANINHLGVAWALPYPGSDALRLRDMVSVGEIERIAVEFATKHEDAQGFVVESVEKDNRGFDLISRKPHPEDPKTFIQVRFIEVKGRSAIGEVALTSNEYNTAQRLKHDYYLYVVFNCASSPQLYIKQNPTELIWQPVVKVEHYITKPEQILKP